MAAAAFGAGFSSCSIRSQLWQLQHEDMTSAAAERRSKPRPAAKTAAIGSHSLLPLCDTCPRIRFTQRIATPATAGRQESHLRKRFQDPRFTGFGRIAEKRVEADAHHHHVNCLLAANARPAVIDASHRFREDEPYRI